jgi:hypothetical protein
MLFLMGLLVAALSLLLAILHLQQSVSYYIDFVGLITVFGGTLAVTIITLPWGQWPELKRGFLSLIKSAPGTPSGILFECLEFVRQPQYYRGQQEILHEILHALGFVHEQSRPDRDQHVEVVWDHIQEKYRDQFERVPESWMEAERGTAFDFHSIMIYSPEAFAARPGEPTLRAKDAGQAVKPPSEGMSEGDLQRLKRLYRL